MRSRKRCPFLKIQVCGYCSLFPVKKMIPVESMKTACMCFSESYINCSQFVEAGGKMSNLQVSVVGNRKLRAESKQNMKGG